MIKNIAEIKASSEYMNTLPPEKKNETMKSQFPVGLQVLAIDDNVVCLKVLGSLLQKCGYKVTMKRSAIEALEMLRKSRDSFDIVITDVVRSDRDGFKLLEIIGLEMDLPVIMTSANGDTRSVVEGIKHGARDYLVKPVQLTDLKNIWQHASRKSPQKEEKHGDKSEKEEPVEESGGAKKKGRLIWSRELHAKFLEAYNKLDEDTSDKIVPKRILEIMNEPGLTRENVASHLQEWIEEEKDGKTESRHNSLHKKQIAPIKGVSRMPISTNSQPKPEIPTPNFINQQKPIFLNQNQCDFVVQKYPYATTQMLDPLLPGNFGPPPYYPALTTDDRPRITVPDDFPGSLIRPAILSPYSCFSGMMPGDFSSQMCPVSEFVSGGNLPGSTLGHTEGGSWVNNIRGNQFLEGSSAGIDDETRFVQLLLHSYSKRETNGQNSNWTSPNGDDYNLQR